MPILVVPVLVVTGPALMNSTCVHVCRSNEYYYLHECLPALIAAFSGLDRRGGMRLAAFRLAFRGRGAFLRGVVDSYARAALVAFCSVQRVFSWKRRQRSIID